MFGFYSLLFVLLLVCFSFAGSSLLFGLLVMICCLRVLCLMWLGGFWCSFGVCVLMGLSLGVNVGL